jgi:CRP-like cAMP-binding protein
MTGMNSVDAVLALLHSVSYLAELDEPALRALAGHCRAKHLDAGQHAFLEGDGCTDLCILQSGRVKFYRANAEGREQVLRVFERPGDTFCIASTFSTGSHIVSGVAAVQTSLQLLDLATLKGLFPVHPSLGLKLMTLAGEHLAHLVDLADDLALKSARARMAKHLHALAVAQGEPAEGLAVVLSREGLREDDLASLLGTVRVNVSRSLASLARAGAIEADRVSIRIRDLAALRRIADGK